MPSLEGCLYTSILISEALLELPAHLLVPSVSILVHHHHHRHHRHVIPQRTLHGKMASQSPAFTSSVVLSYKLPSKAVSKCPTETKFQEYSNPVRTAARMSTSSAPEEGATAVLEKKLAETAMGVWPPPEMTEDWAEAVTRLVASVPTATLQTADTALEESDGDEMVALRLLMDESWSDIRRKREMAVQRARENGDVNRISAVKEAEIRRKATGSARDFFKGYVEVEGAYVDSGYIDDSADTMGKMVDAFKSLFSGKKKE